MFAILSLSIIFFSAQFLCTISSSEIRNAFTGLFCLAILGAMIGPWVLLILTLSLIFLLFVPRKRLSIIIPILIIIDFATKYYFYKIKNFGFLIYEPNGFDLPMHYPVNISIFLMTIFIALTDNTEDSTNPNVLKNILLAPLSNRPILSNSDLQFTSNNRFELAIEGIYYILLGFVKKLIIADRLMIMVTAFLGGKYNHVLNTLTLIILPIYIYIEYTSISDLGTGLLNIMGISAYRNYSGPMLKLGLSNTLINLNLKINDWIKKVFYKKISLSENKILNSIQWNILVIIFTMAILPIYNNNLKLFWFLFSWTVFETLFGKVLKKLSIIYWVISYLGFIYISYLIVAPNSNLLSLFLGKIGVKYGYDQLPYLPLDLVYALPNLFVVLIFDHCNFMVKRGNLTKIATIVIFTMLLLLFQNNDMRYFLFLKV